ncbi:hypothetical protein EV401DRAFT_2067381 [Pisolithus croceorrhizus]|nr:hypothetical protein EV401DRAFT_2067381 [Pisolithus croceorrhizus]
MTNGVRMGTNPVSFARSQLLPHNPSDPSTFPLTSPTLQAVYSGGYQNFYTHSSLDSFKASPIGYTGAPEPY